MNIFARIVDVFARLIGADPFQRQVRRIPVAGIVMTQDQALNVATVWACIDIVAKSVAQCRWNIYEPVPGTKRRTLIDNAPQAWMLNTRANPETTAIAFREAMLVQALSWGNAYAEIQRDAMGRVVALWPLLTDRMIVRREIETGELVYDYTSVDGTGQYRLKARDVFHLKGLGVDGLMGENVIARAVKTIALAAAHEKFSTDFFGRGAQLAGVLEFPNGVIGKDQHDQLRKEWDENHAGSGKAFRPLILEAGLKFTPISNNPKDATLVEDKKFSVEEICRWFGVPPHKVQHLEHATFSNIEHSSIEFVRDSLKPWERRLCQEADFKLFNMRAPWRETEIDLSPLSRGDASSRATAQASWRQNGIMTANELRAMEGLDDVGAEGDILLVQSNLTTVDGIQKQVEKMLNPPAPVVPEGDEEGDETVKRPTPEAYARAIHMGVAVSALASSADRYRRRLDNRKTALAKKTNAAEALATFREEQADVVFGELLHFADSFKAVNEQELTREDCVRFLALMESGTERLALNQENKP